MVLWRGFLLFICFFFSGCASLIVEEPIYTYAEREGERQKKLERGEAKPPKFKYFSVYSDEEFQDNHFVPSGFMGDTTDLKTSTAFGEKAYSGKTCLKVTYLARGEKGWAGIYWQEPQGNWGNMPGGYDLTGAKRLTFWARGEIGGEKLAECKVGGITGPYGDSDVAWIGPVTLRRNWRRYAIDLRGKDLNHIIGGFSFSVNRYDNPGGCTFYLDEIRFE